MGEIQITGFVVEVLTQFGIEEFEEHYSLTLTGTSKEGRFTQATIRFLATQPFGSLPSGPNAPPYPGAVAEDLLGNLPESLFSGWYEVLRTQSALSLFYSPDDVGALLQLQLAPSSA